MEGERHSLPIAERADNYRERAARARAAAELAVEPLARSSLQHVARAWEELAELLERTHEAPSVLKLADLLDDLRENRTNRTE